MATLEPARQQLLDQLAIELCQLLELDPGKLVRGTLVLEHTPAGLVAHWRGYHRLTREQTAAALELAQRWAEL